jgi:hypothetical protein
MNNTGKDNASFAHFRTRNQGFFFLQSAYKLVKAQEKVMQDPRGEE